MESIVVAARIRLQTVKVRPRPCGNAVVVGLWRSLVRYRAFAFR
jgi:hypothetical protein